MNGAVGSSAALWEQYRCANVYYFNFLRPALRQRTVRRLASWKASRRRISGSGQRGRWNDYSLLSLSPNLSRRLFGAEFRCGEIRNGRSLHRGDRGRPTAMLLQPAHAQGQRPTPKKRLGWTLTHQVTGAPRRSLRSRLLRPSIAAPIADDAPAVSDLVAALNLSKQALQAKQID